VSETTIYTGIYTKAIETAIPATAIEQAIARKHCPEKRSLWLDSNRGLLFGAPAE